MSRLTVPSVDTWSREDFLRARKGQMEAQRKADQENPPNANVHYMDGGDVILCDSCNVDIPWDAIILVDFGRRVACPDCYNKWYANKPVTYRALNQDGTLGRYVRRDDG